MQRLVDGFYFFVAALGLSAAVVRLRRSRRRGRPDVPAPRRGVVLFDLLYSAYCIFVLSLYLLYGEAFKTDFLLENPG